MSFEDALMVIGAGGKILCLLFLGSLLILGLVALIALWVSILACVFGGQTPEEVEATDALLYD